MPRRLAAHKWIPAIALAVAGGACASSGPQPVGTPTVAELDRLEYYGQLDPQRFTCAQNELARSLEALPELLPTLRASEAAGDGAMFVHAQSVQAGMQAGDDMAGAARDWQAGRRVIAQKEAEGDFDGAALIVEWVMEANSVARADHLISVSAARPTGIWTDDEARLLSEYTALEMRRSSLLRANPELIERISTMRIEHPVVVEGYASSLLSLYRSPELRCS